ncbi:hypothetical protein RMCBS344292_16077 [Rhizopus microsporus]|nr:hypothetical protein RMCBS344292_16077 [Rhizopus microsporus]
MAEQLKTEKRSIEESEAPTKKKQKLDTIPILRGRFKQRWLTKHSSLLKRSDESTGILISCNVNAETRALGQVTNCLETYITKLFPDHQSTWIRFEGPYDIDEVDQEECEEEGEKEKKEDKAERKERKFQAVDAACGGLVFFRFRVNVKPTEFVLKFMDYIKQLPEEEKKQELEKIRYTTRWIPFDYICPAITERIEKCFERVKQDHFNSDSKDATVAIVTEIRNNILISKNDIIQTIAPLIPSNYKVNLKTPTFVIFVSVFKSACGITVLKDYYQRKKYNVMSYCQ